MKFDVRVIFPTVSYTYSYCATRALPTQIMSYSLGNVTLSSRTSFPKL